MPERGWRKEKIERDIWKKNWFFYDKNEKATTRNKNIGKEGLFKLS